MSHLSLKTLTAGDAMSWLEQTDNHWAWNRLGDDCPWCFPSLRPDYYRIWFRHYGTSWSPLLVLGYDNAEVLRAVFPLAKRPGLITGAGAHQAEYMGWLSNRDHACDFFRDALESLTRSFSNCDIRLHYLAPGIAFDDVQGACSRFPRAILTLWSRPLMWLERESLHKALRKKNTRSKLNRLHRRGKLQLRRLTDPAEVSAILPSIIAMYDLRQGAANDSCPFHDDPAKGPFLLDWATQLPGDLHISCLTLDDTVISAHIGTISNDQAQLAILAYSPFYSTFSPGKLQVYLTAQLLEEEGRDCFDLTPGGDPWKERFANDHDQVLSVNLYCRVFQASLIRIETRLRPWLKSALARISLSPEKLRSAAHRLLHPVSAARQQHRKQEAGVLYEKDLQYHKVPAETSAKVRSNALQDLVRYRPDRNGAERQVFLRDALARLESGQTAYTVVADDRLESCAWLADSPNALRDINGEFPPGPVIHGLYGSVEGRRQLVGRILAEAKENGDSTVYMYIPLVRDQTDDWIRQLGFRPTPHSSPGGNRDRERNQTN